MELSRTDPFSYRDIVLLCKAEDNHRKDLRQSKKSLNGMDIDPIDDALPVFYGSHRPVFFIYLFDGDLLIVKRVERDTEFIPIVAFLNRYSVSINFFNLIELFPPAVFENPVHAYWIYI